MKRWTKIEEDVIINNYDNKSSLNINIASVSQELNRSESSIKQRINRLQCSGNLDFIKNSLVNIDTYTLISTKQKEMCVDLKEIHRLILSLKNINLSNISEILYSIEYITSSKIFIRKSDKKYFSPIGIDENLNVLVKSELEGAIMFIYVTDFCKNYEKVLTLPDDSLETFIEIYNSGEWCYRQYYEFSTYELYRETIRKYVNSYGKPLKEGITLYHTYELENDKPSWWKKTTIHDLGSGWNPNLKSSLFHAGMCHANTMLEINLCPGEVKAIYVPEKGLCEETYIIDTPKVLSKIPNYRTSLCGLIPN